LLNDKFHYAIQLAWFMSWSASELTA